MYYYLVDQGRSLSRHIKKIPGLLLGLEANQGCSLSALHAC